MRLQHRRHRAPARAAPQPALPALKGDLVDEMEVLDILAAAERFVLHYRTEGSYRRYRRLADLVLRRFRRRLALTRAAEAAALKAARRPERKAA